MTVTSAPSLHPAPGQDARRVSPWLIACALGLLLAMVGIASGRLDSPKDHLLDAVVYAARLAIEGCAFVWASRRADLPRGWRQAIGWSGVVSLTSAASSPLAWLVHFWPPAATVDNITYAASYGVPAVALIACYPRYPLRRAQWLALMADLLSTVGGLATILFLAVREQLSDPALNAADRAGLLVGAPLPLIYLAALTIVAMAGRELPSKRAFWWFVLSQALYVPMLLIEYLGGNTPGMAIADNLVFFSIALGALVAAWTMRHDPVRGTAHDLPPEPLRLWNPLPMLATLGVGLSMMQALERGQHDAAVLLGGTLFVMTLLAIARVLLTSRENQQLLVARAALEESAARERIASVGRLAGGIAHEFNSLMTAVIGHAELGAMSLPPGSALHDDLRSIRAAGDRAAALTARLLHFSGRQIHRPVALSLLSHVQSHEARWRSALPARVRLQLALAPAADILADPTQLEIALHQLIANAVHAMPTAGTLRIAIEPHTLSERPSRWTLPPDAGDYVRLEVCDTGTGIAADDLPHVCEPFFTTQPMHAAAGLGLAAVHGIMKAHGGGIAIESAPGAGTRVQLYWPVA